MFFKDIGIVTPDEALEAEHSLFTSGRGMIVYTRDRPTISLGHFSDEALSIDRAYADTHGIAVIRRMSGGSAIYCDTDQITFCFVDDRSRFADKESSYRYLCGYMVDALAHLNVIAEYKPLNDVLVNGMKISGCAQYRDGNTLLHHGSLILRLDSSTMDSVLRPLKARSYGRLTSVEEASGIMPKREDVVRAFRTGFAPALD
jgi:lipoate-protein ligase A